eukprot:2123663-Amphidinium_carterae.1
MTRNEVITTRVTSPPPALQVGLATVLPNQQARKVLEASFVVPRNSCNTCSSRHPQFILRYS